MAGDPGERGTLGTIRNASVLLDLLSSGPAYQQLTELAQRSGLSLPTVHRLLRSLVAAGLVEQNSESSRYSLGPELVRLSERYLTRLPVLRALAPYLMEVRNATKATVLVALLVRGSVVYVDRIDGEDIGGVFRVSHRVNRACDTAAGRVLLAHADGETWHAAREVLAATDDATVSATDRELWAESPYIVMHSDDLHDHPEVAVPVADQRGRVLASLSATGNPDSFSEEALGAQIAPQLLRAAKAASQALSHG